MIISRSESEGFDSEGIGFSIVIPFHNEEDSVGSVIKESLDALDNLKDRKGEIIAVDDGSKDRTAEILAEVAAEDPRVRVITFETNCGQAPALYYGLNRAFGAIVATLDGDGQNNPADFSAMIKLLECSDADLVSGVRKNRNDTWLRRTMSRVANRVRGGFLKDGVTDSGCAIKVFYRPVVDSLIPLQTLYSFIPALACAAGYKVAECQVDHRERVGGETHYGLGVMLWRPAFDMLGVWWFSRRRFAERMDSELRA
tara:strand:- start:1384 stop:2151 length:768 start_codon:yes stop_codon:yes gene_type:complete